MAVTEKVLSIISEALELPPNFAINRDTPISEVPGWDSFAWITILTGLEQYCDREFPVDRVDELRNVGDLVSVVNDLKAGAS